MIPNPDLLLDKIKLKRPLIGVYDAPPGLGFKPLMEPDPEKKNLCIYSFYQDWMAGRTLHLSPDFYGCKGCGYWMFGIDAQSHHISPGFLVENEGLKHSSHFMSQWLKNEKPYVPRYGHLFIGPLRDEYFNFLKSVTFMINPDQLSLLVNGAHYFHNPEDPISPIITSFGPGCRQILSTFKDLKHAQAIIGATDIPVRRFLPPHILAFSVTVAMFQLLCSLDEQSFLFKISTENLQKTRGEKIFGK
ncbi:MAG: DUF169 domain-containing protein [Acidobacteria bacterium]|jgi:hypothetical protein|nr:DUF169 domain-containing protein [Acidobacteriota bacterium]